MLFTRRAQRHFAATSFFLIASGAHNRPLHEFLVLMQISFSQ